MAKKKSVLVHFSTLIMQARLKLGYKTLREFYRDKNPPIDYHTWLHAEAGRRIPPPPVVKEIAALLELNKEAVLIAYCKDKFNDPEYDRVLELFEHNRFANIDALLEARNHERSGEYVFNEHQMQAFQNDVRLRQFFVFTYDRELKTNFDRLASFFDIEKSQVKEIMIRLSDLGLVEIHNETVTRVHSHTTFPKSADLFNLRKNLLLSNLALAMKPEGHIVSYYVNLTQDSYRKVLAFFDFIEANLTKMDLEDRNKDSSSRFHVTLTGNRLSGEK